MGGSGGADAPPGIKIRPLRKIVYTSQFSTGNPKSYNTHIYHFHISESLNLDFFQILGPGGEDKDGN
jgi:hypothetical protein